MIEHFCYSAFLKMHDIQLENVMSSRKKQNKKRIIQTAIEIIANNGFHGMPMSELARCSGVSVGAIYLYFKDKDDLLMEAFLKIKKEMEEHILRQHNYDNTSEKQFKIVLQNILDYYLRNQSAFMFVEQFIFSPYQKSRFDAFSDEVAKVIDSILKKGVKELAIRKLPLEVVTSLVYGSISSFLRKHYYGLIKTTNSMQCELVESCWRAIYYG